MEEWSWILFTVAFFAGLVDSMAGGGGLIQIPGLLHVLGSHSYPMVFGTNKLSSILGTSAAAIRYKSQVKIPIQLLWPVIISAFVFSFVGAYVLTIFSRKYLDFFVPILLLMVYVFTYRNKSLGQSKKTKVSYKKSTPLGFLIGAIIGFYDGFFGPGTGGFLMLAFVVVFGFDFLLATACAKIVNIACNFSALLYFGAHGYVLLSLGLAMGFFNMLGAWFGSVLALQYGAILVRRVLLFVTAILIIKTTYSVYYPYTYKIFELFSRNTFGL